MTYPAKQLSPPLGTFSPYPESQPTVATTFVKNHSFLAPSVSRMSNRSHLSVIEPRPDNDSLVSQSGAFQTLSPPRINVLKDPLILEKDYSTHNLQSSVTPSGSFALNPEQAKKREFLDSLKEQIRLKEHRKKLEKIQQLQEDQRILQEQQEYQYFGKAGAGGIKRDLLGKTITTKKADPNYISNLYGREIYNRYPAGTPSPTNEIHLPGNDLETDVIKRYHKIRLQEELNQQLALDRKLKEEQRRREIMEQQLEEERIKRQQEELRLQYSREQEATRKKTAVAQPEPIVKPQVMKKPPRIVSPEPVMAYKTHVKLQANLGPEFKEGDVDEKDFVRNLPEKVKAHISNVVDNELTRLLTEMRHEENRVMDSIVSLKKEIRDANKGKEDAIKEMLNLREDIKRLKKDDKIRYKEVYSTLVNSLNEPNMIQRTEFNKAPINVKFQYPKKESDKLDRYKVEQHRFFISTPINLAKRKNRRKKVGYKSYAPADNMELSDDSVDLPRISSPPESKDSGYFEKVRLKNAQRLQKILKTEKKNKGFYDRVDEFIKKDQERMERTLKKDNIHKNNLMSI